MGVKRGRKSRYSVDDICRMYKKEGLTPSNFARKYHIGYYQVKAILIENKLYTPGEFSFNRRKGQYKLDLNSDKVKSIIKDYKDGATLKYLSKKYELSTTAIRGYLKATGSYIKGRKIDRFANRKSSPSLNSNKKFQALKFKNRKLFEETLVDLGYSKDAIMDKITELEKKNGIDEYEEVI